MSASKAQGIGGGSNRGHSHRQDCGASPAMDRTMAVAPPREPRGPVLIEGIEMELNQLAEAASYLENRMSGIMSLPEPCPQEKDYSGHPARHIDTLASIQDRVIRIRRHLCDLADRLEF